MEKKNKNSKPRAGKVFFYIYKNTNEFTSQPPLVLNPTSKNKRHLPFPEPPPPFTYIRYFYKNNCGKNNDQQFDGLIFLPLENKLTPRARITDNLTIIRYDVTPTRDALFTFLAWMKCRLRLLAKDQYLLHINVCY